MNICNQLCGKIHAYFRKWNRPPTRFFLTFDKYRELRYELRGVPMVSEKNQRDEFMGVPIFLRREKTKKSVGCANFRII